jgi:hypothetical protein
MTKVGLMLVSIFFAFTSWAQFTGQWQGTGQRAHSKHGNADCSYIGFRVVQGQSSISVSNGRIICGSHTSPIPSITGTVKNGKITYWGVEIGLISEHRIFIDTTLGGGRKTLDMPRQGNFANFLFTKSTSSASETTRGQLTLLSTSVPPALVLRSDELARLQDQLGPENMDLSFGVDSIDPLY